MGSASRGVIAIDPGNDTGWAWSWDGRLVACGLCKPDALPVYEKASLIVECPQVYPRCREVDPNDLITLALKVGRAQQFYEDRGCAIFQTFPRSWKGQTPKDICHARLLKDLNQWECLVLMKDLRKVTPSLQHNVLDAVAINVWFCKAERKRK